MELSKFCDEVIKFLLDQGTSAASGTDSKTAVRRRTRMMKGSHTMPCKSGRCDGEVAWYYLGAED